MPSSHHGHATVPSKKSAYLGWFFISLFFFYQYILRVTPGIITDELRSAFSLTAEQFASLGAIYMYTYAAFQIPLGFIVDRTGIKKVVMISIVLCAMGTFLLAGTDDPGFAQLSRFFMGLGSACAFMSAVKWVADHFPEGKRGFLMGATLTLGTAGALSAGTILVTLVEMLTWRTAVYVTGWMGIGLFIIVGIFMKSSPPTLTRKLRLPEIRQNIWSVITNKNVLIYAALATGLYTPLSVLADLWGVSFIAQKFGVVRADAAATVMYLYIGLALGCLTLPSFSEKLSLFVTTIRVCIAVILGLFCLVVFGDIGSLALLKGLFLLLGFCAGAEMICFTGAILHGISGQSGLTVGVLNTVNMLGGAILQQLIGKALDAQWTGVVNAEGLRMYTTQHYVNAMGILSGVVLITLIISFAIREKKHT